MHGAEEKPKSSLLQNMEMGNAAFWDQNGEAAGAAPNGTVNDERQQGASAAGSEAQQASAQPPAAGSQQSESPSSLGLPSMVLPWLLVSTTPHNDMT